MSQHKHYNQPTVDVLRLMLSGDFAFSKLTQTYCWRDWYCKESDKNPDRKIAITLTLKQSQLLNNGSFQRMSETEALRVIKHLYQKVNRHLFKSAARRKHLKTFFLPAIEGGGTTGKNLHIHLSLGVTADCNLDDFIKWLRNVLDEMPWVNQQIKLEPLLTKDDEYWWHFYISKQNIVLELFQPNSPQPKPLLS